MNPIYFSDDVMNKFPSVLDYEESSAIENFVTYIIHSNYRAAVSLKSWIKKQVEETPIEIIFPIPFTIQNSKYDEKIISILTHVIDTVTYVSDEQVWHMNEYWQTPKETTSKKTGDCDDGAILLYVLARINGVPADRLLLCCADVADPEKPGTTIGHCFLLYIPDNYPLNFVSLDWCYCPDKREMSERDFYTVVGKRFYRSVKQPDGVSWRDAPSSYVNAWFFFNEDKSTLSLDHKEYLR